MAKDLTSVRVEPADLYLGLPGINTVTTIADVADALDGDYFSITDALGGLYHVWFNTSGGSAVDPAPVGSTAIVVAITTGATATTVASTAVTAINAAAVAVAATSSGAVITLRGLELGAQTVAAATSGFAVAATQTGDVTELGYIDGDLELEFEEQLVDVVSQQTGTDILSAIRTGNNLSGLSFVLKQNSSAIREAIMENMGWGVVTPGGGTELLGLGESKQFTQVIDQCKRLVLHPKVLATSVKTRDICLWKAYISFDGLNFSGESIQGLNVSVRIFPDSAINTAVNKLAFGDWTQY
jgi:hypothetical protein